MGNQEQMRKKQSLTDKIYYDIKEDIAEMVFRPGDKLNIKELARKYEVSDTPVKHALHRLADEKIVVNVPNKGLSVKEMSFYEMADIFDICLMMDTFFIDDIITTLSYNDHLRHQLQDNMEAQKSFIERADSSRDLKEYFKLDLEFHSLYLKASGNRKAVNIFYTLQLSTYAMNVYLYQTFFRDVECVAEHQKIFDAILAGDREKLKVAVKTHLENSKKALCLIYKVNELL